MFLCVIIGYILKHNLLKKAYFMRSLSVCVVICLYTNLKTQLNNCDYKGSF
nr:MAG TPA: hypothetical protein [Caudoviricetes sp.]